MGLNINQTATITIEATLAGAPGSFEGVPLIVVEPAGVLGDITIAADNLSATAPVLTEGTATATVTVDNVQNGDGALVGTVTFTTLPEILEPVVLADALNVGIS